MFWFLEPTLLRRLIQARDGSRDPAAAIRWEAEQAAEQEAQARDNPYPPGMSVTGKTAEIAVEGVLTKRPDFWARFFGGGNTTYSNVRTALAVAASSPEIREVVLRIDSPGGSSDGLIELLDRVSEFRNYSGKKLRVRAENALSAAYGIAAAAGNIEATTRGGTFGSIGTAISLYVDPDVVTLTNTDSPDKRPDVRTEEGRAVIVKYLDQINHEFASAIATGRGVSIKEVTEGFGRGASMTAPEAKRLGLIDKIASSPPRAVPNNTKVKAMDQETPDSRAALEQATARGISTERDRVLGHLTMGESCGDMSIALEAIRSGATMTAELTARYLSASMNRADRQSRQAESNRAESQLAGVGAASPATKPGDLGDQVVALLNGEQGEKSFVRG